MRTIPFESIVISMLVEQQKQIAQLHEQVHCLKNDAQ